MVQLEADEAGDEGVHDFVLQVLQQHRELRNAAKGICDLARSHNPLTKHYQRYLDQGMMILLSRSLRRPMHLSTSRSLLTRAKNSRSGCVHYRSRWSVALNAHIQS